jgi:hypothetical protein
MAVLLVGFKTKQELQRARGVVRAKFPGESTLICNDLSDHDMSKVTALVTREEIFGIDPKRASSDTDVDDTPAPKATKTRWLSKKADEA